MGKLAFIVVLNVAATSVLAQTNSVAPAEESAREQQIVLLYKALHDQQQATLHAVEQARQEAEAAAKRNVEVLEGRLQQIENEVSAQRERERESLQQSHRFTLIVVGVIVAMGFVGIVLLALFLIRLVNRRSSAMVTMGALGDPGTSLAPLDPAQQSSARFLSTIERLEQRVHELEATTHEGEAVPEQPAPAAAEAPGQAELLLGKGQALLNLQQAEEALACFQEVIALEPNNAEAFVRKGSALEKLGRLDEAIDCYDRAITVDHSLTMAYLCKGGVFSRQERYGEALQCYEQALRTQQKPSLT
jgi:tetratricopeptide (TPR) repeat protein